MIIYTNEPESIFTTTAKSGFPSPALDYLEERIDLNKELIEHPLSTVFVQYDGRALLDAYIPPGSKLLVDKSLEPENSNLVVAEVDRTFIVRFLKKNQHRAWLIPANKKYKEIEITNLTEVIIWGVVKHVIIDAKIPSKCML